MVLEGKTMKQTITNGTENSCFVKRIHSNVAGSSALKERNVPL